MGNSHRAGIDLQFGDATGELTKIADEGHVGRRGSGVTRKLAFTGSQTPGKDPFGPICWSWIESAHAQFGCRQER
jgi:hypothetical protein